MNVCKYSFIITPHPHAACAEGRVAFSSEGWTETLITTTGLIDDKSADAEIMSEANLSDLAPKKKNRKNKDQSVPSISQNGSLRAFVCKNRQSFHHFCFLFLGKEVFVVFFFSNMWRLPTCSESYMGVRFPFLFGYFTACLKYYVMCAEATSLFSVLQCVNKLDWFMIKHLKV